MRSSPHRNDAGKPFDARTRTSHWLADLSVALLATTCLPALAFGPAARDLQFGGILATVWFLCRLSFAALSPFSAGMAGSDA